MTALSLIAGALVCYYASMLLCCGSAARPRWTSPPEDQKKGNTLLPGSTNASVRTAPSVRTAFSHQPRRAPASQCEAHGSLTRRGAARVRALHPRGTRNADSSFGPVGAAEPPNADLWRGELPVGEGHLQQRDGSFCGTRHRLVAASIPRQPAFAPYLLGATHERGAHAPGTLRTCSSLCSSPCSSPARLRVIARCVALAPRVRCQFQPDEQPRQQLRCHQGRH